MIVYLFLICLNWTVKPTERKTVPPLGGLLQGDQEDGARAG